MPYRAAKISFDGSHYIATPKENFPQGHKRRRAARLLSVEEVEQKEQFEVAYKESQKLPRKERKPYIRKAMKRNLSPPEILPYSVRLWWHSSSRKSTFVKSLPKTLYPLISKPGNSCSAFFMQPKPLP